VAHPDRRTPSEVRFTHRKYLKAQQVSDVLLMHNCSVNDFDDDVVYWYLIYSSTVRGRSAACA
jgi:hypothetical protein